MGESTVARIFARIGVALAALVLFAQPAAALITAPTYLTPAGQVAAALGIFCINPDTTSCTFGGGGGGGAITAAANSYATGFSPDLGKVGDAACSTDNGAACDLIQLVMRTNQRTTSIIAALGTPLQAGGTVAATGAVASFADGWDLTQGAKSDAACAAYTSACSVNARLAALEKAVESATPSSVVLTAGEAHAGEVGGNQLTIPVTPTVTATTYTTGQAMGALQTLANAERVSGKGGLAQSVLVALKVANTVNVDVFIFNANPSGSTCTNASAFVLAAADIGKVVAVAHVTDWTAGNTASFGQSQNLASPYALPSGTSLFSCAVARGSITTTGTSDLVETANVIRN